MSIQSELLLAASGVVDPDLTKQEIIHSDDLLEELETKIRAWVRGQTNTKWSPPTPRSIKTLREQWLTPIQDFPGADLLDDELDQVLAVKSVNDARQALLARFPAPDTYGYGSDPDPPLSPDQEQDFLAIIAVADSPTRFLHEVTSGALYDELRDVFEETYPELLNLLVDAANDEVTNLSHPLPEQKESSLNILLGNPDRPPLVPPGEEANKEEAQQKPNAPSPKSDKGELTTSQRLSG